MLVLSLTFACGDSANGEDAGTAGSSKPKAAGPTTFSQPADSKAPFSDHIDPCDLLSDEEVKRYIDLQGAKVDDEGVIGPYLACTWNAPVPGVVQPQDTQIRLRAGTAYEPRSVQNAHKDLAELRLETEQEVRTSGLKALGDEAFLYFEPAARLEGGTSPNTTAGTVAVRTSNALVIVTVLQAGGKEEEMTTAAKEVAALALRRLHAEYQ